MCGGDEDESRHFLCSTCLAQYVKAQSQEHRAHNLRCPQPECTQLLEHGPLSRCLKSQDWTCLIQALEHEAERVVGSVRECPNPQCRFRFSVEPTRDGNNMVLCPRCTWFFCTACLQQLNPLADDFNHACLAKGRRMVEDALAYGKGAHCGNQACLRRQQIVVKDRADQCNKMKCPGCRHYFCYLCDKDLGVDKRAAARSYGNGHGSPWRCPLFNTRQEVATAIKHRQTK